MSKFSRTSQRLAWMRHALESRSASVVGILTIVLMGFIGFAQVLPNLPIVMMILAVILFEFQKRLDQGVPLLQVASLVSVLQWLVGPALNYWSSYEYGRYSMYVTETEYFRFAMPATAFYVALMLATGGSVKQANLLRAVSRTHFVTIGVVLNVIGIAASVVAPRLGGSLAFLAHLISQFRYIGAFYFLFSKHRLRYVFVAASCSQLLTGSLASGMFHDMILWLGILFCFWFALKIWNVPTKLFFLAASCVCLFSIQVVKQEYRQLKAAGQDPSIVRLLMEYMTPGGQAWETDTLSLAVSRLNQGWIISAVISNVPEYEPYAEGETISDALLVSLVPRMLWTEKKRAGGRESFRRFTGLEIADSTSMSISPLGEAYANFGVIGGIGLMIAFGAMFAICYHGTLLYSLKHPTFLFWIPLIFYQAIKAETEFSVVLNQLTKGAIVAFGCHFLVERLWPTRMRRDAATNPGVQPGSVSLFKPRSLETVDANRNP